MSTPMPAGDSRPGATVLPDGSTRFEVWAPGAHAVSIRLVDAEETTIELTPEGDGADRVWVGTATDAGHGARYWVVLDDDHARAGDQPAESPDPASRWQPDGVTGPSAVVDPATFVHTDDGVHGGRWGGVPLAEAVIYELHVGTFTADGTLDAAADELGRLAALGVTVVELMPLAQFSGRHGWGYDGVFPAAVHDAYGGPDALARFVDRAHRLGLAVVLDVVFNHLGPEGNVLWRFAPYTTDTYRTPWGDAVNVAEPGSDQVRRLFVDTIRQWIDDYHLDGLRFDAVHAVIDPTPVPLFEQLVAEAHRIGDRDGRHVLTILESPSNDPRMLADRPLGWGADAQWNDEYHHAIRVSLTGDRAGYYVDFDGPADVADILRHTFKYRGQFSPARGRSHGRPVDDLDQRRFVVCDQNHDQVGNRRDGDRLDTIVDADKRRLALAAVLLSPFTPMLWMGEEYGDPAPFPFFADHSSDELRAAVRNGRKEEFAGFDWEGEPPDPYDPATRASAVLDPSLAEDGAHAELLALTKELLGARRHHPELTSPEAQAVVTEEAGCVTMTRSLGAAHDRRVVTVVLNFSDATVDLPPGEIELATGAVDQTAHTLAPWAAALLVRA